MPNAWTSPSLQWSAVAIVTHACLMLTAGFVIPEAKQGAMHALKLRNLALHRDTMLWAHPATSEMAAPCNEAGRAKATTGRVGIDDNRATRQQMGVVRPTQH